MLTEPQTSELLRRAGPIACQPWCDYGDGHPAESFRADQVCYSAEIRTWLSLHPPIRCADGNLERDYVGVQASQRPDEAPQVELAYREWPSVALSPEEARRLVAGLNYAIAVCESSRTLSHQADMTAGIPGLPDSGTVNP